MFDLMVYAILLFGFPLGVLVGYRWRDRISRERRARHQADQDRARNRWSETSSRLCYKFPYRVGTTRVKETAR